MRKEAQKLVFRLKLSTFYKSSVTGKKVRYKPIREELREEFFKEGREEGRAEMIRSFICSGFLTDEQIAIVTKQSPEDVAALRHEIEGAR